MPKATSSFVCQQCGAARTKWSGRCDNCGAWNSFVEQVVEPTGASVVASSKGKVLKAEKIDAVKPSDEAGRMTTGMPDIDEVLGGGMVPASVVLVAGQPGIGKSTLLMQVAANVAKANSVLYISGEE